MATLFDSASLVMIPSGYKDDKLYSIKPTDGSGDFTFSRDGAGASPATRVNASGLIEKGRENLLLQSNQFDTTWTSSGSITLTSGQSDKDGGTDAWLMKRTDGFARYIQQSVVFSGVNTFSFYSKAESQNWIYWGSSSGNAYGYINVSDGSIGANVGSLVVAQKTTSVGNGFYRVEVAVNASLTYLRLYPAVADGSITGGVTDAGVYIQSAQLEQGLVATDYIETTTAPVSAGLLGDMPRLDYSGGATCPSLLLEPSRINHYIQSEYLYNFDGDETFNAATSPEGVSNATKLTKNSASDQFLNILWTGTTISPSTDYTISLFVKYSGYDVDVRYEQNSGLDWGFGWSALFEVRSSGVTKSTTGNCTSDVEDYGNGWYRILVFVTSASSVTPASPSNLLRVIGASGDEVLVYGAQLEAGSYPTSYIPTYGSASTRGGDNPSLSSLQSNGIFSSDEGTLMIEFTPQQANYIFDLTKTTAQNIRFFYSLPSERLQIRDTTLSAWYFTNLDLPLETNSKVLLRWSGTTLTAFINGTKAASDYTLSAPIAIDLMDEASTDKAKQLLAFPTALTDAECIALTTL